MNFGIPESQELKGYQVEVFLRDCNYPSKHKVSSASR